ncbi:VanZ family protein [Chryseobacterium fluminis]|uniref:VanZ family protein n=1 Tax=Chryseobacterium fluminis TaxID=2983606 RepID=UPI002259F42F|nr:VanZ family protein [Chryseobacterium sp. MMS21-Ot14]UZT99865.1 VanZ family protein [Chryseobacterium sp. MMS21-Ot14]
MIKKFYKIIIVPYTFYLLYLMFLGMGRFQYEDNLLTLAPVLTTVRFIKETVSWRAIVIIVLGNIVMFIPFGFLDWVFPQLSDLKKLIFTFVSAIVIVEGLQYFTRMGIFEVDDILLNTFGVWIGWLICQFLEKKINR